jgi:membrane protease YdiL (CAAX protease family)
MIPSDPEIPPNGRSEAHATPFSQPEAPISFPAAETASAGGDPAAPPPRRNPEPFWGYGDLVFFILLLLPSLGVLVLVALLLTTFTTLGVGFKLVLPQTVFYALALGCLGALFRFRYDQPLWRSLGWRPVSFGVTVSSSFAGLLLALILSLLGSALHTPEIPLPFQQMPGDRTTIILLGILVVILGPLCEELAFRGFLMPLLIRSLGAAAGIVATGVIFGCAHGYEYQWSWRHIVLISTAGSIFGWARYKTGSTAAAAFMHATFNLTQFAAFLAQARTAI